MEYSVGQPVELCTAVNFACNFIPHWFVGLLYPNVSNDLCVFVPVYGCVNIGGINS